MRTGEGPVFIVRTVYDKIKVDCNDNIIEGLWLGGIDKIEIHEIIGK